MGRGTCEVQGRFGGRYRDRRPPTLEEVVTLVTQSQGGRSRRAGQRLLLLWRYTEIPGGATSLVGMRPAFSTATWGRRLSEGCNNSASALLGG